MKVFRRKGIRFICGVRDMDVSTSSGMFHASTEAANNRRWRDQISEDIRRDHQFKVEMGMFSRNPSCLGFRSKGRGSQQVDPIWDELDLVMRIFFLFVTGDDNALGTKPGPMGRNGIASYLMDQGVRWPKGIKGHKSKLADTIHERQIRTVLTNCMYVGRWRHAGREYPCDRLLVPKRAAAGNIIQNGKRVTAVPLQLFQAAQEKLARMDRRGRRSLTSEHMLTGWWSVPVVGATYKYTTQHIRKGTPRVLHTPTLPVIISGALDRVRQDRYSVSRSLFWTTGPSRSLPHRCRQKFENFSLPMP